MKLISFYFFYFSYWLWNMIVFFIELSGLDLMMADLKAMEAYTSYFYYQSKKWSKPLPEAYDAEEVADYFSLRPHLLAFRLLEVVKTIHQQS